MFKKTMQTLDHIVERISYYGVYAAGIIVGVMAFMVTYGVVRRYIFNDPEPYSYELSTMFLVISVVLAIPYIQRVWRHLRVDILAGRFPEGMQVVLLNIFVPLLALFYLVLMTWYSLDDALYSLRVGERTYTAWAPPLFPLKIWVPIGVGILCLVLFAQFCRGIYLLKEKISKSR